jgi:hypothetical protein
MLMKEPKTTDNFESLATGNAADDGGVKVTDLKVAVRPGDFAPLLVKKSCL